MVGLGGLVREREAEKVREGNEESHDNESEVLGFGVRDGCNWRC